MERKILTTRKTNIGYLVGQLLGDAVLVALGVFSMNKAATLRDYWRFSDAETMSTVAVICFIFAFLSFVYHIMVSSTYIDVQSDRITGKGMQKISLKSINLSMEKITDLSISKGFLNVESGSGVFLVINTTAGSYKVVTNEARAKEIVEYYNNTVVNLDR